MINEVLREKSHCVVCQIKYVKIFEAKNKITTNVIKIG